jgi:hypothetical protein
MPFLSIRMVVGCSAAAIRFMEIYALYLIYILIVIMTLYVYVDNVDHFF